MFVCDVTWVGVITCGHMKNRHSYLGIMFAYALCGHSASQVVITWSSMG